MALIRTLPEKDSVEGYEEPFNRNADAVDVRGVYVQNDTSNDAAVLVDRDASDNLTFTDPVAGTKTLAQLAAGGGGTVYAPQSISSDTTVTANCTWFQHDVTIASGINLTVADGADLMVF